jgi:hypothetical protein
MPRRSFGLLHQVLIGQITTQYNEHWGLYGGILVIPQPKPLKMLRGLIAT